MRARINFSNLDGKKISYDYQYKLASVIYRKLGERSPEIAEKQHSKHGSRIYTFSGLLSDKVDLKPDGIVFHEGYFVISSPDSELISNAVESFLDKPLFEISGEKVAGRFEVEKAEVLKPPVIGNEGTFRTLSPVYLKTIRQVANTKKEFDLFPNEPKFYERLHFNLISKFELFYNRKPVDHFDTLGINETKTKRVKIGDTYRRCSLLKITFEGSQELLKFAYDAGIGEKTAMGFGCLDIL